jgi:hypothetical protein
MKHHSFEKSREALEGGDQMMVRGKERVPPLVTVPLIAALTELLTLPPLVLPTWAAFLSWAATLLLGQTGMKGIGKMWPSLVLGSTMGLLASLLLVTSSRMGVAVVVPPALIAMPVIFVAALALLLLGRLPWLSAVPAAFVGFASLDAAAVGNTHTPVFSWLSVTLMLLLGPLLAAVTHWLTGKPPAPARSAPAPSCVSSLPGSAVLMSAAPLSGRPPAAIWTSFASAHPRVMHPRLRPIRLQAWEMMNLLPDKTTEMCPFCGNEARLLVEGTTGFPLYDLTGCWYYHCLRCNREFSVGAHGIVS